MYCKNCASPFEILLLENGKNKYCKNCGNLLYKNVNNSIVLVNDNLQMEDENQKLTELKREQEIEKLKQLEWQKQQQEIEHQKQLEIEVERRKQEELLKKRQLELEAENKRKADEIERLRLEELKRQVELEAERKRQEEIIRLQQLELEVERKRIATENERKRNEELAQQLKLQEEQRKRAEEEIEKLKKEKLELLEKSKDKTALEVISLEQKDKEEFKVKRINSEVDAKSTKKKVLLGLLVLIVVSVLSYFLYDQFVLKKQIRLENETYLTDTGTDTIFTIEKIKTDLVGKDVYGWGLLKANEISNLHYNVTSLNDTTKVLVELDLNGNSTTAKTVATLSYQGSYLISLHTDKIIYQNPVPLGQWYTFSPLENCAVMINTNGFPLKFKNCETCPPKIINSSTDIIVDLIENGNSLFIQSDTSFEFKADFIYLPK